MCFHIRYNIFRVLVLRRAADMLNKEITGLRCNVEHLNSELNFIKEQLSSKDKPPDEKTETILDKVRTIIFCTYYWQF